MTRSRRRWRLFLLGFALLVLVAGGALAVTAWLLFRPFQGFPAAQLEIEIPAGEDAGRILARLQAAGVLTDARLAKLYLVWHLGNPPLRAGVYRFQGRATTPEVLDKLVRGEVVTVAVTLIEGLTLAEIADTLAAAGFGEPRELEAAFSARPLIADLDPEAENLEGYLFPDTYHFAHGTRPETIATTLIQAFRRRFETEVAPLLPADKKASVRALVTLASLVEKEARLEQERPLVAAVYRNRLARGMALYADPTIIYALKLSGRWDGNLRRPDLDLDSPFNTYRRPGLPPGPICSPGVASLLAAAAPAQVPYLYFVSRNDGSHAFATTLAEHNRNVERWQKRYWRERWAAERAAGQTEHAPDLAD